jgi:hypothetical protein
MKKIEAIEKLIKTGEITTGMLKPLGISFESWLRYAQAPKEAQADLVARLIDHFEANP